jgi:non-ribosomal peptide synthetase component E (peptide arylation enzyme)
MGESDIMTSLPFTSESHAARYRAAGIWKDETFFEKFARVSKQSPKKPAIVDAERSVTYEELAELVDNVAGNLLELGLEAGDVVALQSPNAFEIPLVHLACNRAGLLFLPMHDSWRAPEVRHLLAQSNARVIITPAKYRDFDHAEMIASLRTDLPMLRHHFTLGGEAAGSSAFDLLLADGPRSSSDLDRHRPHPDLPAHIMLSGGTTSLSKMSRYSCNDLLVMLGNFVESAAFTENDVVAALAPAGTGATGYIFPILTPLLWGATSVVLERWGDPRRAVDLILDAGCTVAVGVPTQLTQMVSVLEGDPEKEFPVFRLFFNAGAPLPENTGLKVEDLMDCVIQCMYGSTDGGVPSTTTVDDARDKRIGTVGRIVKGCECEIWNEEHVSQPQGTVGEVVWRGADKSWGYLGDDEETARTFTKDGFYLSGDLGRIDDAGYLQIVGRIKDMILRGGRNISPLTIEEQLIKHPSVCEVSVTGIPDEILGERACAFVTLEPNCELSFETAIDFLKAHELAVWQLPERLEIVDTLPRGPGGKVQKAKLRDVVVAMLEAERSSRS